MQHSHHDTSTQAMTEVALGLSMAFFSLLILALFSIGLPDQVKQVAPQQLDSSLTPPPKNEQLNLAANSSHSTTNKESKTTPETKQQYVFYFNGQFYDEQLTHLSIESLSNFGNQQSLILAVQENLPLLQVMAVRKQINHANLSITMLNQKWQNQLEQVQ
jgi:hypothetical protein